MSSYHSPDRRVYGFLGLDDRSLIVLKEGEMIRENEMKRTIGFCLVWIVLVSFGWCVPGSKDTAPAPVVLAMSHPTPGQIDNIAVLRKKGLLNLRRLCLLGFYHEDERTGYDVSREHVRKKEMKWVKFLAVKGDVSNKELFSRNRWTSQFDDLFLQAHGILFTGGSDIPPSSYGDSHHLLSRSETPVRCRLELSFMFYLLGGERNRERPVLLDSAPDFPILGICLGVQVMNVAGGGTLWQDIPMQIYGRQTAEAVVGAPSESIHSSQYIQMLFPEKEGLAPAFHPIRWKSDSLWQERFPAVASPVMVLSNHHQAIRIVAEDLVVQAVSMDGKVVEAISHRRFPQVLGVQFHPEYASLFQPEKLFRKTPSDERNVSLPEILSTVPGSRKFHHQLWSWFGDAMIRLRDKRGTKPVGK